MERLPGRAAYPRYFRTPEGRPVSIRKMAAALRAIRANPGAEYPGWDWFPVPGHFILREFRRGLHDRINLRGASHEREAQAGATQITTSHDAAMTASHTKGL